jgi:hypothetical protein
MIEPIAEETHGVFGVDTFGRFRDIQAELLMFRSDGASKIKTRTIKEIQMFLEVYAIPLTDYSSETEISIRDENRRLIEMTGARIRTSSQFEDRAEIILPNKEILVAAGSYEDLVQRMVKAGSGAVARI